MSHRKKIKLPILHFCHIIYT
ncbi:hypothetical protein LCGC14_2120680, partial [marine sediment metagenome]